MSRADQAKITVRINRTQNSGNFGRLDPIGTFDKRTGGSTDSDTTKYRPGGMQQQVSLGGPRTVENVTVERLYQPDDIELARLLRHGVGKWGMVVEEQALDRWGAPVRKPIIWRGILKSVKTPDRDSESSAAAIFSLEMDVSGEMG